MQDLSDNDQKQVLGEVLFDQLKAIQEGISNLPTRTEFREALDKIEALEQEMTAVKLVIKDHSHELNGHDDRLAKLETQPA